MARMIVEARVELAASSQFSLTRPFFEVYILSC